MQKIVLASESPRRREILATTGINFVTCTSNIDETLHLEKGIEYAVQNLALMKAKAIVDKYPNDLIVGADTMVVIDNEVLGKPKNDEDAKRMLTLLSGREHRVITGVAMVKGNQEEVFYEESIVTFYELDESLIEWYIKSKEPRDKAGAYGIQGKGALLVRKIVGDYFNIVGLPIASLYRKIQHFNR